MGELEGKVAVITGAGSGMGKASVKVFVREGAIVCRAVPVHLGRTTQVWDAEVSVEGGGAKVALFRCTQMVLWPK